MRKHIPVNHKNTELLLQAFKCKLENMKDEASVLNNDAEFHNQVRLRIARLYTDERGEFKGQFQKFQDTKNINKHVFKKPEGSKQRLAIAERFNQTGRRMLTIQ